MTRIEFIQELERLLFDIPAEERREAIEFYENYFEEAGNEEEEKVITELGSPADIAEIIKKSLDYGNNDSGYFSEDGYHETESVKKNLPTFEKRKNEYNDQRQNTDSGFAQDYRRYQEEKNRNVRYEEEEYQQKKKPVNIPLLIILILFALPIGLPIAMTILCIFLTVIIAVASIWLAFAAVAVALFFAGTAIIVVGLIQFTSIPALGISMAGGGLIVLGIGLLFTIAAVWTAGKALPAVIGWIKQVFRSIFRRRRAYA